MRTRRTWGRLLAALAVALVAAVGFVPRAAQATEGNVAKIGDKEYPSLAAAVAAVPADGAEATIVLTDDIKMTTSDIVTIKKGQNVRLELNGHTISAVKGQFNGRAIVNNGTLVVNGDGGGTIDVSMAGSGGQGSITNTAGSLTIESGSFRGSPTSEKANIWNNTGATLDIKGGRFDTSCTAVGAYLGSKTSIGGGYFESPWYPTIDNSGEMTITGGEFVNTSCSACNAGTTHWGYTIRSGQYSDQAHLDIKYATVTGTQGGVSIIGGTADIYDGVFKTVECLHNHGAVFYALYVAGESYETSTTVYGGTFSSEKREAVHVGNNNAGGDGGNRQHATLEIKGGSFTGGDKNTTAVAVDNALGGASISGGTFSSDISEFLADGMTQKGDTVVEQPDVASVDGEGYKSFEEAVAAAQDGQTVTLLADASTTPVTIDKGITLDLGGHTLSLEGKEKQDDAGITFTNGASTIKDGSIVDTCQIARTFAVVVTGQDTALTMEDAALTVEVPVKGDGYGMRVLNGAELTLNAGAVVNSAPVSGNTGYIYGINVYGNGHGATFNEAVATKLTVNEGATVEAYAFAVSGNGDGTKDNTLITINGGTLVSEAGPAIYHPQYGKLVINGGTLDGCSGVEIRAGELMVNGGTIKGDTRQTIVYPKDQIGGGNSVDGGGIIVAQHSTKLPVKVTVNGGTIEANTAFIQHNVMGNDQESIDKIEMSITGGEFVGALRSDNFKDADDKGFVSGGSFGDRAVGDYLAPDAAVAVNGGETPYDIFPSTDEALENGGAHAVVDKQGNTWVFADKDAASSFAGENGSTVKTVTHTVTFDDCLPTTANTVVEVENGSPVARPTDPACEGWKFLGWYEFANGSYAAEPYDFAAPVRSDLTLYAKWEQIEEEPEVTPQNPSESEKDDGLAQTGDVTSFLPAVVAGAAGLTAAAVALTLRRRSK